MVGRCEETQRPRSHGDIAGLRKRCNQIETMVGQECNAVGPFDDVKPTDKQRLIVQNDSTFADAGVIVVHDI
jgi:hypothetical protein